MTWGRLFLLLLLALGVGLYFEQSRTAILEFASPAVQPALRWMTNQELKQIAGDLEEHVVSRGSLPARAGDFDRWLRDRYRDDNFHTDAWGTPYRLRIVGGGNFRVVSAGTDREFDTPDDLTAEGSRNPAS